MCEFLWTVEILSDYTYRTTSTKLPTERNKFAWVKLSLDFSLRFSRLSLTLYNDNILGQKHPLRGDSNQFTHPRTSQKGVFKKFSARFPRGDPTNSLIPPISKIMHETLP